MPKIIFTVTNDLTYDQRMIRICRSLSKEGYKVELIGRKLRNSKPLTEESFGQKRFNLPFEKGKLFYLSYHLRLFFFLLLSKFDAVCSIDMDTLIPGYLACKLKRKVFVYDAHEYFEEVPEVIHRPVVRFIWQLIGHYFIPKVKYAYTVSVSLAEEFNKKYKNQFEVIRNLPVSKNHKDELITNKSSTFILIYQGVLNVGRGLEQVIEALENMEHIELWLVGEGDLSRKLRELVTQKGLEQEVKFYGKTDPEELHFITRQAHLGLNLLQANSMNYYYSLANKAFDYIQAGIPSLNMNFPEYKNLNERYNVFYLLDTLETKAIANAVNKVRSEQQLFEKLQANCKIARNELIWEKEEKTLFEFYKKLPY